MKLLIIGIDGGDKRIFESFEMPFVNGIIKGNVAPELTLDLMSRGWAEMLTGEHASATKALYMHPKLDGTREFTTKYDRHDFDENSSRSPLWKLMHDRGYRLGMMNIPTTSPVKEVNGFHIGGAGGTLKNLQVLPQAFCYPRKLVMQLTKLGYVLDMPFRGAGTDKIETLMNRLNIMMRKRTETFISLSREYRPDLGFVAYRATAYTQYLAMSEIERFIATGKCYSSIWTDELLKHYSKVDESIKLLLNELSPDHYILVSDHGMAPYKYTANIDDFLIRKGYMKARPLWRRSVKRTASRVFGRRMRNVHPNCYKAWGKKDFENALAFGHYYVSGIFINDKKRFNGPVGDNDYDRLVKELCQAFNDMPEANMHDMKARPYRSEFCGEKFSDHLPDIKIECSDTIFFTGGDLCLVDNNINYGPVKNLNMVTSGMHTGQKGRNPLFCADHRLVQLMEKNDPTDLRLVYNLVSRVLI
ncbi:alkaline phosphatase family protein [Desulfobacterota bacterium M19]